MIPLAKYFLKALDKIDDPELIDTINKIKARLRDF